MNEDIEQIATELTERMDKWMAQQRMFEGTVLPFHIEPYKLAAILAALKEAQERAERGQRDLALQHEAMTAMATNLTAISAERDALAAALKGAEETLDEIYDGEESLRLMNFGYVADKARASLAQIKAALGETEP